MGQEINHVSFDLWMTLIRSHPEFKKKRAELFCRFFSVADLAGAESAIRKTDLVVNHINETTGGNIDALEMYLLALHQLNDSWKSVTPDCLERFYSGTELLFENYAPLPVDDSVTDGLKMMQDKGLSMNILSNTGFIKGKMLRKALDKMDWAHYFSFSIFSDETGHSKPHTAMFGEVWNEVKKLKIRSGQIAKKEVLHFGDNPFADVEGGKKYGFSTALFLPDKEPFYQQIKKAIKGTT